ncbi:MAG: type II secretion system protein GspL [Burkholderiaceae bacterium]
MSLLVIQLPERRRMGAGDAVASVPPAGSAAIEYRYLTSADGRSVQAQGECAAALLPAATTVIAVLGDADVSWHRIVLPKAPANRLRAALVGVLEESLLDDPEAVHLALAPGATPGQPTWIAAVDRVWVARELARLEQADVRVERLVPMAWPDDPPAGHFFETAAGAGADESQVHLSWAHADGVACIRLHGGLARALVPEPALPGTRWSTTAGAATAAEVWLGAPVAVMTPAQRLLQASRSLWNLRQFDLVARTRGALALRDGLRRLASPAWRPVRWGVVALVAAQIVGLNFAAWQQGELLKARRTALLNVVSNTYPRVSTLDVQRDAAAVMQREAQAQRTLAGKAGEGDLEPMLQAAAVAWPADRGPVESLRFEPGQLSLAAAGWSPTQIDAFRNALRPLGLQAVANEGRLVLSRARPGAAS